MAKVTFGAMAKVAQSINLLPVERQQSLLSNDDLLKTQCEYIQIKLRFRFQCDKLNKTIQPYDIDKSSKTHWAYTGL